MRKFNEMISTSKSDDNGISRILRFDVVDDKVKLFIPKQIKKGYTPYYFDVKSGFELLPLNNSNVPVKLVTKDRDGNLKDVPTTSPFTRWDKNPYGVIYFLTEDEHDKLKPMMDNVSEMIRLVDEKRKLMIDLVGSIVQDINNLPIDNLSNINDIKKEEN